MAAVTMAAAPIVAAIMVAATIPATTMAAATCCSSDPAPATLVVNLPADAVLTVNGKPTTLTSAKRVFRTPTLKTGRDFEYTLEAKVVRDGQEKVIKQRVTVRAGEQTMVRLEVPTTTAVAAK